LDEGWWWHWNYVSYYTIFAEIDIFIKLVYDTIFVGFVVVVFHETDEMAASSTFSPSHQQHEGAFTFRMPPTCPLY
jgi:hypothetical protein